MSAVTVYGASDDCVEVEGAITEEYSLYDEPGGLIFSDGTALRIEYDSDGVWRITPLSGGTAALVIEQAPADDEDNYSDRATLTGDLRWVIFSKSFEFTKATG